MSAAWTDPVVLICAAIILLGVVAFIWAVGKLRGMKPPVEPLIEELLSPAADAVEPEPMAAYKAPEADMPPARAIPKETVPPPVNKDVAERLENMAQRLSEMQTVLSKQASAPAAIGASAAGSSGQGFSPETIDKLLKIIGNVIQQVDILQKSMAPAKSASSSSVVAAKTDAPPPTPTSV